MDKNGFLDALTAYSRNPCPEIPAILEQYLTGIAANGETLYHWPLLKPLLFAKMEQVIEELQKGLSSEVIPDRPNVENVPFDVMHTRIVEAFHKFNGVPFTIQRLCELLIDPKRHYKRSDKFLRGLEKNVLVVSTVDPFGRNVVSEVCSKHLVNGMDTAGSPFFPRDSNITSNLPPVPGWVTAAPSVTSPQNATSAGSDQKQAQPSSQDAAATTSVVSGVVTSLYGEQPQAPQTEEVVEETVVTMDTTENSVADSRETGSEEDGMEREDSNTSSSSSSSSEELSTNDTSDNSPDVPTMTADTSLTSPWVSVLAEGDNKVQVSSSDAAHKDQCGGVSEADSSGESDKSTPGTLPAQADGDGQVDSLLSCSEVNSSNSLESESSGKSSSCVDGSSSEVPMDTSCVQQDSYNDSTGFDTAFTSVEVNTQETSGLCHGSEDLSGVGSEAPDMDTTSASRDVSHSSQTVDSRNHSEVTASPEEVITPASIDEHTSTPVMETPDCPLDSTPSSPPTQPVDLSPKLHSSAGRTTRTNPSSPDSKEPQAKRRRISHEPSCTLISPKTSTDVSMSSDIQASFNISSGDIISSVVAVSTNTTLDITISSGVPLPSNTADNDTVSSGVQLSNITSDNDTVFTDVPVATITSDDVTMSLDSEPLSSTESKIAPDCSGPAGNALILESDPHGGSADPEPEDNVGILESDPPCGPADSEPAVHPELHEGGSEGRECVASPPSQEASSSDSQGFDATVESQHLVEAEATNIEGSAKLEGFDQVEELNKTEEPVKEEEQSNYNLLSPQN